MPIEPPTVRSECMLVGNCPCKMSSMTGNANTKLEWKGSPHWKCGRNTHPCEDLSNLLLEWFLQRHHTTKAVPWLPLTSSITFFACGTHLLPWHGSKLSSPHHEESLGPVGGQSWNPLEMISLADRAADRGSPWVGDSGRQTGAVPGLQGSLGRVHVTGELGSPHKLCGSVSSAN